MKSISIRELHEKTGEYIRKAAKEGELLVTFRGKTVAKIVPQEEAPKIPYFARRVLTPGFRKLMKNARLRGGTDATRIVSEDRDRPIE
jgi:prevent-host-death family protein